ncbi:MAG: NADH:ubiquinone reductase (Na(+)-transporting) subunit C [Crocinitomicaceae bacterium]|nr:NADH:ubiquinone reductase (Na(+)-transporting) subunit C [Crocinitomicaceae bacterium]MAX82458.1 NADH:ubiquinone reductase (Na(+)-transporting) subunit C [Crocinitomicaceae bacterium]
MDKNSNGYTFGFAIVLVVVVGALLSFTAMSLKKPQQENIKQEKMKSILMSVGIMSSSDNMADAPELFNQYVTGQIILNDEGQKVEREYSAFDVDVQANYKKMKAGAITPEEMDYPLFKIEKDGETTYVVPLVGTGLWGPIWGYIALEGDMNTVKGAIFAHKGETPGLGAEITTENFQKQFVGEQIFEGNDYVSISVLKGGGGDANKHAVDGITGGTITSRGVGEMLDRTLGIYVPYFKQN